MNELTDTIAAISTPPGEGGIGIIRISGPEATTIADRVFISRNNKPLSISRGYSMRLGKVYSNTKAVDDALALLFKAPRSYTGEDVVEIHCHGGPVLLEMILRTVTDAGARAAMAGEFTRRAYVNGRISLTEAEGIAGIISAVSKQGEAAAYALSNGSLYKETIRLKDVILELQSSIAACLDFPEEDVEPVDNDRMIGQLNKLRLSLQELADSYETGINIMRGIPTAIVGSANVGKSTLMNLLSGYEKTIVTPIAGTTRDVVEHQVRIGGTTLFLADTAGIRESEDEVEKIGIDLALHRADNSALVLAVFDGSRRISDDDRALIKKLSGKKAIAVINKIDLKQHLDPEEILNTFESVVYISANDPMYYAAIEAKITEITKTANLSADVPILMNERQRSAVIKALFSTEEALKAAETGMTPDVVFISLDDALAAIFELSGENASDAVIDEVFSRFCVGK